MKAEHGRILRNAAVIGAYLGAVALMYYLNVPCVFKTIFGIPCPGCGMTHALIHASNLELVEAFRCHAMFWSVPFLFGVLLLPGRLFQTKARLAVLLCIAFGFAANWIYRIVTF